MCAYMEPWWNNFFKPMYGLVEELLLVWAAYEYPNCVDWLSALLYSWNIDGAVTVKDNSVSKQEYISLDNIIIVLVYNRHSKILLMNCQHIF